MIRIIRLPFIGEERTRILVDNGYDIERIKNAAPEEIASLLHVSKYIAYLIIKAARELNVESVPDELISKETLCPKCGNVITELEYECGKCGYPIKDMDIEEYEKNISEYVDTYIKLSKSPRDIALWEKLQRIYEDLGNVEEALDVSLRIDLLKDQGFSPEDTHDEQYEMADVEGSSESISELPYITEKKVTKTKFKNGLVNGFGVKKSHFVSHRDRRPLVSLFIAAVIVMGVFTFLFFSSPPYSVDGNISEWGKVPSYHTFSSSISSLKMGEYGNYYYFAILGTLDISGGVDILIDSDGNPSTGYTYGLLGAEYRLHIYSDSGILKAILYHFESNDTLNWNGWTYDGGVRASGGPHGIELQVPKTIFTQNTVVEIINGDQNTYPIGLFKPLVIAHVALYGGAAENGTLLGKLYLNNTYFRKVDLQGIKLLNGGNAHSTKIDLYVNGSILGTAKLGEFVDFKHEVEVNRGLVVDLYYGGGGASGSTIVPYVTDVLGAGIRSVTTGDGFYVKVEPAKPVIDGVYADWSPYRNNDTSGDAMAPEDIVAYAKYVEERMTYFYLQTRGRIANGMLLPVYHGGPEDSDRDGIPDSEDPYPHDFNNDGIKDEDSYVVVNGNRVPDIDGDGVPDYPHGEDYWLNTTIPNSTEFPEEFRGRKVSIYIGPPRGAEPLYPYDYIEVYISGSDGFEMGGIKAEYLFRLYGVGGKISGFEFYKYDGNKFVRTNISFNLHDDLAKGWSRLEFRMPLSVGDRDVLYRIVSYGSLYEDIAHRPFRRSLAPPNGPIHVDFNERMAKLKNADRNIMIDPDSDDFAGYFAREIKNKYSSEVDLDILSRWISTLDLEKGVESTHVFTGKDFIDGDVSHFKEEDYAYQKMKELIKTRGLRPIYRVELLNETVFREEWENLTEDTKRWEILHWMHDLEKFRLDGPRYDNPYKLNWYDEKAIRSIEWLVYRLSMDINNWRLGFEIVKGIKSIDDAKIGPFLAVYPSKDARLTDWSTTRSRSGPTYTVTFQLVRWHSGTSDCNGDNDGYLKITLGSFVYNTAEVEDDDTWNAKIILTNSNNSGTTAYVRIENWEDDSGLCGGDDDFGSASFTYNIQTKTWSGSSSVPYVHTSGDDGSADDWFVIESDWDNEASLGVYGVGTGGDPNYGGWCINDPWDSPTLIKYYGGAHYWGIGIYVISFFAFYVPAGTQISVYLQPSNYNYDLYLYNTSGYRVAASTNGGTAQDSITYTADKSGFWYLGINATGGYSDWFQFWFTSGPDDKDYADISPVTGAGDTGYLIQSYGGVTYYDASDEWKFYIPPSWISGHGVIYFWMKPNPNANFNVELYDPEGNLKQSGNSGGTGQVDYVLYELQSGDPDGWWYVRVVPATATDYGNYSSFYWVGYVVDFHAQTDNQGTHTPMYRDNGVKVTYYTIGRQYEVYPSDEEYWHVYVDRGSSYQYASESNNSNDASGHRWISPNPPSGTINSGGSIVGHYYEQYYLTVVTSHDTGYSSGKYFGSDKSYSNPGSGWYDAGCTVTIHVDSPVTEGGTTYQFVSWSGSGTGSYSGSDNPASFVIQDVTTETANWNEVPEFSDLGYVSIVILGVFIFVFRAQRVEDGDKSKKISRYE